MDLVEVVLAREGGPVAHHLGQAAAHAPHVHALRVALKARREREREFVSFFPLSSSHLYLIFACRLSLISP